MDVDQIAKIIVNLENEIASLKVATGLTSKTKTSRPLPLSKKTAQDKDVNFSTNARAFFKQYVRNLSGKKKFVLVLAYLAKGSEEAHSTEDIAQLWTKMGALMDGAYANVYSTRAKEQDWVDSPKTGFYVLRPTWKQIFS